MEPVIIMSQDSKYAMIKQQREVLMNVIGLLLVMYRPVVVRSAEQLIAICAYIHTL